MIESLDAVLLALTMAVNAASGDIRIQTQSLAAPKVLMALEGARKRGVNVSVVLGAKAEYTLDSSGQPMGGNRPYDSGPQGMELRALDAMRAKVFIPPRFSELDRAVFESGVEMNANFAVIESRWAALCTAPIGIAAQGICWATEDKNTIAALISLNTVDESDRSTDSIEADIGKTLATKDLVLTPANTDDFYFMLRQPWRNVIMSHLVDGKALDALISSRTPATFWMAPNGSYARSAIDKLKRSGWTIANLQKPFLGMVLTNSKMAYIGSQSVDAFQIEKSRGLGIVLNPRHVPKIESILQIK
jgi:hypothetical protein